MIPLKAPIGINEAPPRKKMKYGVEENSPSVAPSGKRTNHSMFHTDDDAIKHSPNKRMKHKASEEGTLPSKK